MQLYRLVRYFVTYFNKKKSLLPDVEAIKQVPKCLFKHQYDYNNK